MNNIAEYLDHRNHDRGGIYPYREAEHIAIIFTIPITDAMQHVTEHIRRVLAEATQ